MIALLQPPVRRWQALAALVAASALTVGLGGCASPPAPVEQLAVAEAAVQRAGTASTAETAAMELRVATDKLAAARSALAGGDRDRARQLAEQAEVDAQVAEIHAQARRSRKAAQETQDAARVLREEMDRKAPR
jgi:Domain of unknown function (DUF4398)